MAIIQATGLKTGDTIEYHGALCTILAKPEDTTDQFGQPLLKFWARREDTGEKGYIVFGPKGVARTWSAQRHGFRF